MRRSHRPCLCGVARTGHLFSRPYEAEEPAEALRILEAGEPRMPGCPDAGTPWQPRALPGRSSRLRRPGAGCPSGPGRQDAVQRSGHPGHGDGRCPSMARAEGRGCCGASLRGAAGSSAGPARRSPGGRAGGVAVHGVVHPPRVLWRGGGLSDGTDRLSGGAVCRFSCGRRSFVSGSFCSWPETAASCPWRVCYVPCRL